MKRRKKQTKHRGNGPGREVKEVGKELQKGNRLLRNGNLPRAADTFREILRRAPRHAGALHMLGVVHARAGDLETAVDLMRQSVQADPHKPAFLFNLARAYQDLGRFEQASAVYREYLHTRPDDTEAIFSLGRTLFSLKQLDEAGACFQQALRFNPQSADASYNLGVVYAAQGRKAEAIAAFRQALAIRPANPVALCALGKALGESGRDDEAAACFQQALRFDPEYVEAYYDLGVLYNTQGQMAAAIVSYQMALAVRPRYTPAFCALAKLKHFSRPDKQIDEMERLFAGKEITDSERLYLAFGLGKALEDCGEHDKAFAYLRAGNMLKRKSYDYSIAQTEAEFNRIKEIFSPSFISQYRDAGLPADTPIFILGMPRSGTSLVEQILASHPDVSGGGELQHVRETAFRLAGTREAGGALTKIAAAPDRLLPLFAETYLEQLGRGPDDARHITDKMPHNFLFIGLLRLALPRTKIIHCVRDPMDNCVSIYKQLFTGEHKYAYDLEELGRYYLLYRDLMQHWHLLFPGAIYDIGYEALVQDQEGETRKLLQHCGLPWDDGCLSFHLTARKVTTASLAQVRKPIYTSSVRLWRQYREQLQGLLLILAEGGAVRAE